MHDILSSSSVLLVPPVRLSSSRCFSSARHPVVFECAAGATRTVVFESMFSSARHPVVFECAAGATRPVVFESMFSSARHPVVFECAAGATRPVVFESLLSQCHPCGSPQVDVLRCTTPLASPMVLPATTSCRLRIVCWRHPSGILRVDVLQCTTSCRLRIVCWRAARNGEAASTGRSEHGSGADVGVCPTQQKTLTRASQNWDSVRLVISLCSQFLALFGRPRRSRPE